VRISGNLRKQKKNRKIEKNKKQRKLREEAWRLYYSVTVSPNTATPDYAPPSIITGVDREPQAIHLLIL